MIDAYRDLKAYQRAKRLIWGVPCPVCREKLSRANAKILEPGRICRAHKPSYRDTRPEPTEEAFAAGMAAHGRGAQSEDYLKTGDKGNRVSVRGHIGSASNNTKK